MAPSISIVVIVCVFCYWPENIIDGGRGWQLSHCSHTVYIYALLVQLSHCSHTVYICVVLVQLSRSEQSANNLATVQASIGPTQI